MEVLKKDFVELLVAMGVPAARKWEVAKLQQKVARLQGFYEAMEEPLTDKALRSLYKSIKAKLAEGEAVSVVEAYTPKPAVDPVKPTKAGKPKKQPEPEPEPEEEDDEDDEDEDEGDEGDDEDDVEEPEEEDEDAEEEPEEEDEDAEEDDTEEEDTAEEPEEEEKPKSRIGRPPGSKTKPMPGETETAKHRPDGVVHLIVETLKNGSETNPVSKDELANTIEAAFPDLTREQINKKLEVHVPYHLTRFGKYNVCKNGGGYWIGKGEGFVKPVRKREPKPEPVAAKTPAKKDAPPKTDKGGGKKSAPKSEPAKKGGKKKVAL